MPETFRTFIAVKLDAHIQTQLQKIQAILKKIDSNVKWVEPKNIHLTLKFLGEIPMETINKLTVILPPVCMATLKFSIALVSLGAFPGLEYPRVIWIGIDSGQNELKNLAARMDTALNELGFKKESRPFDPHITLGRLRSSRHKAALINAVKNAPGSSPLTQTVENIYLFKSTLTPVGPIYEILKKFPLGKQQG